MMGIGAGKSTLLNTIQGMMKPLSGSILFLGKEIAGLPPHKVIAEGIVQVPEGRRLFPFMTIRENLLLGAYPGNAWSAKRERIEWVMDLFPILRERAKMQSRLLSGGEQQMLTIGRGLMAQPRLLMVDEPSLGLAPVLVDEFFKAIHEINKTGTTVLLIEQNARKSLSIATHGYVFQKGEIVAKGTRAELCESDIVQKTYLRT